MLLLALQLAEKNRPHGDVFRVVEAMQASKAVFNNFGLSQADSLRGKLERYKERFGAVDPALTVPQIEKALEPDPLIQINKTIAGLLRDAGQ